MKFKAPFPYRSWLIFLTLFFFPPLSMYLMWKGRRYPVWVRVPLTCVGTFIGLVWTVGLFTERKPVETTSQPKKVETPEEEEHRIAGQISDLVNEYGKEIVVKRDPKDKDYLAASIKYNATVGSNKITRYNMINSLSDFAPKLFGNPEFSKLKGVIVEETAPLIDLYGNSKTETIGRFVITRETAQKINWANIPIENIEMILKIQGALWYHPSVLKDSTN